LITPETTPPSIPTTPSTGPRTLRIPTDAVRGADPDMRTIPAEHCARHSTDIHWQGMETDNRKVPSRFFHRKLGGPACVITRGASSGAGINHQAEPRLLSHVWITGASRSSTERKRRINWTLAATQIIRYLFPPWDVFPDLSPARAGPFFLDFSISRPAGRRFRRHLYP